MSTAATVKPSLTIKRRFNAPRAWMVSALQFSAQLLRLRGAQVSALVSPQNGDGAEVTQRERDRGHYSCAFHFTER